MRFIKLWLKVRLYLVYIFKNSFQLFLYYYICVDGGEQGLEIVRTDMLLQVRHVGCRFNLPYLSHFDLIAYCTFLCLYCSRTTEPGNRK